MKILIVDDNKEVRLLLRDYLPASANEVFECEDGQDAFTFFKEYRPDWVLMDWQMPNKDGITATREIVAEYPEAQICLITNFDDDLLKEAAIEAGAQEFVLKQNLHELEAILVNELEH